MRIKSFYFLFILVLTCCQPESKKDYSIAFKDCMEEQDLISLNKACAHFENQIADRYEVENIGEAYKAFLKDITSMNIEPEIFNNTESKAVIQNLKETGTFDKIWSLYDPEITDDEITDDEIIVINSKDQSVEKAEKKKFYTLKTDGAYIGCFEKVVEGKEMKQFAETIKFVPDISPGLTSGVLVDLLSEEEYNSGTIQMFIALYFYYQMTMLLGE